MITKVGNKNISQKKYFNFNENKFIYSTTTSEPTKSKYLHGDELFNALKQYNYASKYYNENLNNNKPVITDAKTLNQVLQDPKASKNLYLFIGERARYEISKLNNKAKLTQQEKDKLVGLKEIANAFPTVDNYIPQKQHLSFKGEINKDQKTNCHLAIHTASAICAGLSGMMGEGAAVGADTPFLWGTQGLMFMSLKKILNVDHVDHMFYILRQLMMGQVLGVQGAKLLINWLGVGGHVLTGGTASAIITPAIQAINGTLSGGITEKMGWGYVSACENDRMTWKKQALQTAIYSVGMGVFGHGTDTLIDAASPDNIQTAMEAIPKQNLYAYGKAMKSLIDVAHLDRFGFMFGAQVIEKLFFAKDCLNKDEIKNSLKIALMNTAIYDLIDYQYGQEIQETTIAAVNKLGEEIKSTPEVFAEFQKSQRELFDKIDIDKMSTAEFIKKFKDKKFVYNVAMLSGEISRDIADKWRKRDFGQMIEKSKEQDKAGAELSRSSRGINIKLTPEQKKELENSIENTFNTAIKKIQNSSSATCLERIAGYEETIKYIDEIFIQPIRQKSFDNIPSAILFYGPTGTGKTSIGVPLAQTTGSKFIQKGRIPRNTDVEALYHWLQSKAEEAEKLYKDKGRHTIIQINEMGNFRNATTQQIEQFNSFISDCAQKHHLTIFFTTNEPLTINNATLDKMKKIPMGIAKSSDIEAIIKLYLGTKNIENLNIRELVDEFEKVQPNAAYSNAQIQNIMSNLPFNSSISQNQLLDRIKNEPPAISKQSINDFNDEVKQLS